MRKALIAFLALLGLFSFNSTAASNDGSTCRLNADLAQSATVRFIGQSSCLEKGTIFTGNDHCQVAAAPAATCEQDAYGVWVGEPYYFTGCLAGTEPCDYAGTEEPEPEEPEEPDPADYENVLITAPDMTINPYVLSETFLNLHRHQSNLNYDLKMDLFDQYNRVREQVSYVYSNVNTVKDQIRTAQGVLGQGIYNANSAINDVDTKVNLIDDAVSLANSRISGLSTTLSEFKNSTSSTLFTHGQLLSSAQADAASAALNITSLMGSETSRYNTILSRFSGVNGNIGGLYGEFGNLYSEFGNIMGELGSIQGTLSTIESGIWNLEAAMYDNVSNMANGFDGMHGHLGSSTNQILEAIQSDTGTSTGDTGTHERLDTTNYELSELRQLLDSRSQTANNQLTSIGNSLQTLNDATTAQGVQLTHMSETLDGMSEKFTTMAEGFEGEALTEGDFNPQDGVNAALGISGDETLLDLIDDPITLESYSGQYSQFLNGTCPSVIPIQFGVAGRQYNVDINYQPACDLMANLGKFLLFVTWITVPAIVFGRRS